MFLMRSMVTVVATAHVTRNLDNNTGAVAYTVCHPPAVTVHSSVPPSLKVNTARFTVALNHVPPAIIDLFEDLAALIPSRIFSGALSLCPSMGVAQPQSPVVLGTDSKFTGAMRNQEM
jgi:hypothetical protein